MSSIPQEFVRAFIAILRFKQEEENQKITH